MKCHRLDKKTAFVTGGTGTIGRQICERLAKEGATIIFTYFKNEGAANSLLEGLKANGKSPMAIRMDITKRQSIEKAFKKAMKRFDGIDILVNNAGINYPNDFDKIDEAEWDKVMNVNLKGPFMCTQEALPYLKDGGAIINIGSVSGQYGGPRTAHYAASKAGLISLGQVIARFLAPRGIRVNTVAAGLVESEMASKGTLSPAVQQAVQNILLKRMATPAEIASVVAFLASEDASYITAQTINVNGGLYF